MYQSTRVGLDDCNTILQRQRFDEVLLAEVEVHGALVHGRVRAVALDETEKRAGLAVDDRKGLRVARAQRDAGCRVVAALPDVAGRRLLELGEQRRTLDGHGPECLGVLRVDRSLVGGRQHVRVEDPRVRVVENRCLDPAREQGVRLAREELVERVVRRHEDRESSFSAAGASPLLPERCDGSREADRDGAVEKADVDPELECVGRRYAEKLALDETPLDLASLLGGVAGPVRSEPSCSRGVDALGGEAVDQLGCLAALREADRPQSARGELGEEPRGVAERSSRAARAPRRGAGDSR